MNSSTNSEMGLLTSTQQHLVKVKQNSTNKENKLQRFSGAVFNGGTLVFGKIKSLWSHNSTGLNTMLADSDRRRNSSSSDEKRKSQDHLGLFDLTFLFVDAFAFFLFLISH